jgi:hypothetical protein
MIQAFDEDVENDIIIFLSDFLNESIYILEKELMLFIALDNTHYMDCASWKLFELLSSECYNLILILCL